MSDFTDHIRQLKNNAALLKKHDDGSLEAIWVSEDFTRMMECSEEEALRLTDGNSIARSTHPDDRLLVKRMLRRRVSEEGGDSLFIRKITAKGHVIWCSVHFAFVESDGEKYIYCTYFDVTIRKEYEERLRSAYMSLGDNFYRMDELTLGMFRVNLTRDMIEDIQGRDLFSTDSRMYSFSEIIRLRSIHYPIRSEREHLLSEFSSKALIEGYLAGNMMVSRILYSERRDGSFCYVELKATITRQPMNGDVIAFVTERQCNTDKVREMLLSRILARQFDMVAYLSDRKYGVVIGDAANIEKGSIFPLTRNGEYEHYLESQVFPVLHGTDLQKKAMTEALALGTVKQKLKAGESYVVNIACDIDGETYYKRFDFYRVDPGADFHIVLKSDTTDVQREQIERNMQLAEALKEAEQANVAKTAFLSRMSHEIRTPMNAIIGLDNIALQGAGLPRTVKENLEKIGSSARYLLSLINDILDMSRIESGRMVLKNEEFSFSAFLDQVNTMVDGQCRDRGLHYDCVIHGTVEESYIGDDTKLKQVLVNILGNAVKFTGSGGTVSLSVERISHFEGHSTIRFRIRDTGIGMDREYLPRIFDAFSQEDATTTSSYGGSGLGMAITKNIVKLMNGDISVESEKGVGTTFTVDVTLKDTEGKDLHRPELDISAEELKVLIVDDDPVALGHGHIVLEEIGITSDTALSGSEALEMIELKHARNESYNLILVDLKMPGQNGVEVTRKIREIIGEDTAIVILTAYSWAGVEAEAIEAGVDGFMNKPLFASNVLCEFRQAFKKRKLKGGEEPEPADLAGRRILLAEDMLINAEIMKQILTMKGMEVEYAENGKLAAELFDKSPEHHFDAILMDVRMPVMDGLESAETIRALDRADAKEVPIIAMTANAFDEDVQRSLQAGMNAHLSKPVEPDHLFDTLARLIAKSGSSVKGGTAGGKERTS